MSENTLLHELGNAQGKTVVMIHGTGMSWDMLKRPAEFLTNDCRVILVSVPGHDPKTDEEFTSVEEIAKEIETALIEKGYGSIDLLYGLSMGGGIAIRMLADNKLKVKRAVIDAGIAPYELPRIVTRAILLKDFLMTEWGKHSKTALSYAFPVEEYSQEALDGMFYTLQNMSARTIWRVYDSTDNFSMPKVFPKTDTLIEYWYGEKEEKERKADIRYVEKHIPGVSFRVLPGMKHGQYIVSKTTEFAADLRERLDR